MEKRIIDIETMLAHHEAYITQMSDLIADQWRQIETLQRQIRFLSDSLERAQNDARDEKTVLSSLEQAAQDKPPHY